MTTSRNDRSGQWAFLVAGIALVALLALAGLVDEGKLARVDGYAVRHLMHFEVPQNSSNEVIRRLFTYTGLQFQLGPLIRLPASAGAGTLLILMLSALLWRRGRRGLALLWIGAFLAAAFAEAVGKLVVTKPPLFALYQGSLRPAAFHHSFPSGHALRALILAGVAASLWPRAWPILALWVIAVVVSAEHDGMHTPSDIAGGLLLGTAVIAALIGVNDRWGRRLDVVLHRVHLGTRTPLPSASER